MPVFFTNVDGTLGVPLVDAAAGHLSLHGANQLAPLGDRTTTKIRIGVRTHVFSSTLPSLTVYVAVAGLSAL